MNLEIAVIFNVDGSRAQDIWWRLWFFTIFTIRIRNNMIFFNCAIDIFYLWLNLFSFSISRFSISFLFGVDQIFHFGYDSCLYWFFNCWKDRFLYRPLGNLFWRHVFNLWLLFFGLFYFLLWFLFLFIFLFLLLYFLLLGLLFLFLWNSLLLLRPAFLLSVALLNLIFFFRLLLLLLLRV